MTQWADYVRWFYTLSPEQQQAQWEKFTAEQRKLFETARASATQMQAPASKSERSSPPPKAIGIGCGVLLALGLLGFGSLALVGALEERQAAARSAEEQRLQEEERQASIDYYFDNSAAILAQIEDGLASGQFEDAVALSETYLPSQDSELVALHERAKDGLADAQRRESIKEILAEIEELPESNTVRRRDLYLELTKQAPEEAEFASMLELYARRVEEQVESARKERERGQLAYKWTYHASTDDMTGRTSHTAAIQSENTVNFGFPYQGQQHATLSLRTHPSYGRDVIFRIERGQLLCRRIDRCQVRVRFDEGQAQTWTANPPADHSTTVLFLQSYDRFLQQLRRSQVVRIQPEVYQEGNPVFEFRVGGYDHQRYTAS